MPIRLGKHLDDAKREYPDNSELYARKAEGRRQRARLSFAEKLDAVDALRARVQPIVRARDARTRATETESGRK